MQAGRQVGRFHKVSLCANVVLSSCLVLSELVRGERRFDRPPTDLCLAYINFSSLIHRVQIEVKFAARTHAFNYIIPTGKGNVHI